VILNVAIINIIIHANIVTIGIKNIFPGHDKTRANNIPDNAHAGPYILCLLDAKIDAINQAYIAVNNHTRGAFVLSGHKLATANDIERGIFIKVTANAGFQLLLNKEIRFIFLNIILYS
jgi:hypothetical protein